MGVEVNDVLRRLARDQWVRLHGTPRVTVLVGKDAKHVFATWLALADLDGHIYEGAIDRAMRDACAHVGENPHEIAAVVAARSDFDAWRTGRTDRLAAMADEGFLEIPDDAVERRAVDPPTDPAVDPAIDRAVDPAGAPSGTPVMPVAAPRGPAIVQAQRVIPLDARSAAEAALYQALEATPSTAGRFELNGYLSVRFGSVACEVDLLSRADGIAIEIDGVHHFADPSCYRRDRRKDLLLQTHGLIVIRVLAEDVIADPRDAITSVCQALAHRRGTP